jgi:hypothetical protein
MQVLTPSGGKPDVSLQRWQAYFMPQMLKYLEDHKQATDEITFVYGDTHTGGWGEMPRDSGSPIRIYNTGAWIVPAVGAHPPCHIFAVQDDGEECVLDFSFKDVSVSGENIVVIAGRTAQYKYGAASWVVRLVEPVLGPILRHYAGSI